MGTDGAGFEGAPTVEPPVVVLPASAGVLVGNTDYSGPEGEAVVLAHHRVSLLHSQVPLSAPEVCVSVKVKNDRVAQKGHRGAFAVYTGSGAWKVLRLPLERDGKFMTYVVGTRKGPGVVNLRYRMLRGSDFFQPENPDKDARDFNLYIKETILTPGRCP